MNTHRIFRKLTETGETYPEITEKFQNESKQQKIIERRRGRGRERRMYLENSKGDSDDQSNLQCGASNFFFFPPSGV